MSSENIVTIDSGNWKSEVLDSATPVLVDFWAPWCGPCRAIAPILEELAKEMEGSVKIAKVNVDELQSIAAEFGIRSIPTLIVIKDGKVVEQAVGLMSKAQLKGKLEAHVA